jgi:hypothetical protein
MMKAGKAMSNINNPTHPVATVTARKAKRYDLHCHDKDVDFSFIPVLCH